MKIPLVDLKSQYQSLKVEIDKAIASVIETCQFIGGGNNPYVKAFEAAFSEFCGAKHCVACGNGTDSLEILLKAMGIGPGDEVIVPALSWIATSESVSNVGAKPVFVDILPDTFSIDPSKIEEKINSCTKAIIPVHLYGLTADMDPILDLARKFHLRVLEDCAQAHGAEYKGRKAGTMGDAGAFSFYPGKNLGAYGDAGAMITNCDELSEKARMISNHGQIIKHQHSIEGRNSRLDGMQAAILSVKLPFLNKWNELRRQVSTYYAKYLDAKKFWLPPTPCGFKHVFHIYAIRYSGRDRLLDRLRYSGVECTIHYPVPLPFLNAYKKYDFSLSDFPVAKKICNEIISLPMFPELKEAVVQEISTIANQV